MKIVKAEKYRTVTDLARLDRRAVEFFLNKRDIQRYLIGNVKLDSRASKVILTAERSIDYVQKFSDSRVRIRRADHIIALLCMYSDDSFGTRVLAHDFHKNLKALQQLLEEESHKEYNAVRLSVVILNFMTTTDILYDKSPAPFFLLINFFLFQEGFALALEDTDEIDNTLSMTMRYKVESFAKKL